MTRAPLMKWGPRLVPDDLEGIETAIREVGVRRLKAGHE
jgi:hypothetical protein